MWNLLAWTQFRFAGVLGIKVKIMLPHDPKGQMGPKTPLPDNVQIVEPKDEVTPTEAYSEHKEHKKPQDIGGPAGPIPGQTSAF